MQEVIEEKIIPEFKTFKRIPRLSRPIVITEKIDGTNAQVHITEYGDIFAGSRSRWLTATEDNYGWYKWVMGNKDELLKLGPGSHFGEWWGQGIQRKYDLKEKRWSLFNVAKWCMYNEEPKLIPNPDPKLQVYQERAPACCHIVPILCTNSEFNTAAIDTILRILEANGSFAAPGFMKPEGIVIYHKASGQLFKKTLEDDQEPKGRLSK